MLKHGHEKPQNPSRVVVLGSQGFVGSHIVQELKNRGINVLALSKHQLDLLDNGASANLLGYLKPEDALVVVSAIAPCKNNSQLLNNLKMIQAVTDALEKITVSQIVYISSDAVYADQVSLANESSKCEPSTLHGMMHSARELMLKATVKVPLAILRASLLYGLTDPHNGYGPNRFRRLVAEDKTITLFGEGEEKRDHIHIEDVAKIVALTLQHRSQGTLNIATGQSHSFREVAEMIVSHSRKPITIQGTPRQNPITHRHFDITACHQAFPNFHYTALETGLIKIIQEEGAIA